MSSKSVTTEIDQVKGHGETSVFGGERPVWYRIWRRRLQTKPRLNKASFLITRSLQHYPSSQFFKMMSETFWMFLIGWDLMVPKMCGNQHWFQTGPVLFQLILHSIIRPGNVSTNRQNFNTDTVNGKLCSTGLPRISVKKLCTLKHMWMFLDYRNRSMHCWVILLCIVMFPVELSSWTSLSLLATPSPSHDDDTHSILSKNKNMPRTRPHCCQTTF